MSKGTRVERIQARLDALTGKWWLYLLLLLLFFIPTYASKGYDRHDSIDLIGEVLSDPLINASPVLMPLAKIVPVVLIAGVLAFGNRVRRAFNVYAAVLFFALALFQTAAITEAHGFVVISGNLALVLVVALAWVWETIAQRNDFEPRARRPWKWWVAPLAIVALFAPIDSRTMSPDFSAAALLANEAGLTCCMMTPVVLAVLTLFYPSVNRTVLRVHSFAGLILGAVNMAVWFFLEPWGWWMGVLHIPLVVISVYAFVLGHRRGEGSEWANERVSEPMAGALPSRSAHVSGASTALASHHDTPSVTRPEDGAL
jgi:hypothetical protein